MSKNPASTNVAELADVAKDRAARLRQIAKDQGVIQKQRSKLDAAEQKLVDEANSLMSGSPAPKRRKNGAAKPANDNGKRARATSKTGETLPQILLRVAPSSKEDAVNKDVLAERVAAEGYVTASGDPKVVIGQALGKHSAFKSPSRGLWQRSASGDKEAVEQAEAAAAPAEPAPAE